MDTPTAGCGRKAAVWYNKIFCNEYGAEICL
jgi:hypothetical protein